MGFQLILRRMPMRTCLRMVAFIGTLVVISPREVALGQTVQCPTPQSVGASTDLPSAAEGDVARAEAILRDWPSDWPPIREQSVWLDSLERSFLRRLRDTFGESLAPTLLSIVARPMSRSPFRVTSFQAAAAFFYGQAGLADAPLERILLLPRYEIKNRIVVFRILQARDLRELRLSNARLLFVCGLAREVDSAPPDEVRLIRGYLMEVFKALDTERLLGSRPAAALLDDPGIRSVIDQLKALDSLPESREPGR